MARATAQWLCLLVVVASCSGWAHAAAPQTVLESLGSVAEASQVVRMISTMDGIKSYLQDPKTVCTGFLPSNEGMAANLQCLGSYAGKIAGNVTRLNDLLSYHIIPGRNIKSTELKNGMQLKTRQGEVMYVAVQGNETFLYSNPKYLNRIVQKDIPTAGCTTYVIEAIIPPPSWIPMMDDLTAQAQASRASGADKCPKPRPLAGTPVAAPALAVVTTAPSPSPAAAKSAAGRVVVPVAAVLAAAVAAMAF